VWLCGQFVDRQIWQFQLGRRCVDEAIGWLCLFLVLLLLCGTNILMFQASAPATVLTAVSHCVTG
jgi:hypothetical protein